MDAETEARLQALKQLQGNIAINLRRFRAEQSLTQEKLAELASLDARHIQKLEAAQVNVTLRTVVALSRGLSIRPDQLLSEPDPDPTHEL